MIRLSFGNSKYLTLFVNFERRFYRLINFANKMKQLLSIFIFYFISEISMAQIPRDVPNPSNNSKIDLSNPADLIIYIVIPIALVIFYFIWKRKSKVDEK